jgi:hypothetical protein
VIEILKTIAGVDREHRYALRPILQACRVWFDDDVDPEVRERTMKDGYGELLPERVSGDQTARLTHILSSSHDDLITLTSHTCFLFM